MRKVKKIGKTKRKKTGFYITQKKTFILMDKENSKQGRHKAKKEEWNWTNVKIQ
jgi:hypothetical protein